MNNLIFLDVEATGTTEKDYLIQLAYRYVDFTVNEYFKPPVPISVGAMAVHHITNKDVRNMPEFSSSHTKQDLVDLLDKGSVLVAHNANYDIGMLNKEGVDPSNHICTLKVARHLDDEAQIESYALQYLRYYLGLEVDLGGLAPHDAMADVLVLEKLFERLSQKLSVEEMIEISKKPSLVRRFTFGKHNGKLLSEVAEEAPDYLQWLLEQKQKEEVPDEDWIYTINHYLNGNPR